MVPVGGVGGSPPPPPLQSGAWKQMGAQPCSTPTGVNIAFEDQKHWAGIVILQLLVCSRACATGYVHSPRWLSTAPAVRAPLLCRARGVRPLSGARRQQPMLGHLPDRGGHGGQSVPRGGRGGQSVPRGRRGGQSVPRGGRGGRRVPMQYLCAGPVATGGTKATWPLRPSSRGFRTRDTAYLVIPYNYLPEPVTVVREMAGVAVDDGGTDSLELDGGGVSVGWRWIQASSQACCPVVNGGSSASISQVRQRGRRYDYHQNWDQLKASTLNCFSLTHSRAHVWTPTSFARAIPCLPCVGRALTTRPGSRR